MSESVRLDSLPDVILDRLSDFLVLEDCARLAQTCHRLYEVLPRFLVIRGKDFKASGPHGGHFCPELYFEGPVFTAKIKKVSLSIQWKDQGWGNRKGEIFIKLVRKEQKAQPASGPQTQVTEVAEKRQVFGIAEHELIVAKVTLGAGEPVVSESQPGDFYRFMRNVGGGGVHQLFVNNFKAIVSLSKY